MRIFQLEDIIEMMSRGDEVGRIHRFREFPTGFRPGAKLNQINPE